MNVVAPATVVQQPKRSSNGLQKKEEISAAPSIVEVKEIPQQISAVPKVEEPPK